MVSSNAEIGDRIRRRREKIGLKQYEVAAALETNTSTYSRLEKGENMISATDVSKLAKILRCSVAYLTGDEQEGLTPEEQQVVLSYRMIRAGLRPAGMAMLEGLAHFDPSGNQSVHPVGDVKKQPVSARGVGNGNGH